MHSQVVQQNRMVQIGDLFRNPSGTRPPARRVVNVDGAAENVTNFRILSRRKRPPCSVPEKAERNFATTLGCA